MADIKVTGFINAVKTIGSGTLIEVAEKHSRKNAAGEWEKDGTATYYDVWVDRADKETGSVEEGNLVTIEGSFRTKVTEKDGRKFYTNVINARTVTKTGRGSSGGFSAPNTDWASTVKAVTEDEAPF